MAGGSNATRNTNMSQNQEDFYKAFLAGIASVNAANFTHPIDTIKIRMQIQKPLPDGSKKYRNMIQGILLISKEEGIRRGIYKGIEGAWLRESVYSTIRLGLYEPIKRGMHIHKDSSMLWKFMAGSLSGLIGAAFANPFDMIKIRMQASTEPLPVTWHVKEVYSNGGVAGFWRGVGPTCIRAMLMNGTKLAVYDTFKHGLIDGGYLRDGMFCQFVASAFAGFFQSVATSPMDNIKTRIMNQKKGK
jgi:hypothetical protein